MKTLTLEQAMARNDERPFTASHDTIVGPNNVAIGGIPTYPVLTAAFVHAYNHIGPLVEALTKLLPIAERGRALSGPFTETQPFMDQCNELLKSATQIQLD